MHANKHLILSACSLGLAALAIGTSAAIVSNADTTPRTITETVTETVLVPVPTPYPSLAPCDTDDGTNCYWDASTHGNGKGKSFVNWDGVTYYPKAKPKVRTVTEYVEVPVEKRVEVRVGVSRTDWLNQWPTAPLKGYDEGVLMCGVNAAPALDTTPDGNNWAYCEPALAED